MAKGGMILICGGAAGVTIACALAARPFFQSEKAPAVCVEPGTSSAELDTALAPQLARPESATRSDGVSEIASSAAAPIQIDKASHVVEGFSVEGRLAKLEALHERFSKCSAGTELEWRVAYDILTEAMLVEKDRQRAFEESDGAPFKPRPKAGHFYTYNGGRQYGWTQSEYPILASMFTTSQAQNVGAAVQSPTSVTLKLSEEEREAAILAYNTALVMLPNTAGSPPK